MDIRVTSESFVFRNLIGQNRKIEITDFGFPDLGYLIVEGEKIESTDFGSDSKDFGFLQ